MQESAEGLNSKVKRTYVPKQYYGWWQSHTNHIIVEVLKLRVMYTVKAGKVQRF